MIDEHSREIQIDFGFAGFWIWDLTEEQRGVLRVHHDEFDEALRHLAGLDSFLDFRHMEKSEVIGDE